MLYFVATPIGNLKDVTLRAIEVLKEADVIACEDTRHSLPFLREYGISKPLIAYHKFNEVASCEGIISLLKEGKTVAVISDAGTPLISDPGSVLCKRLIKEDLPFTVIPGACAFVPALLLSGMDTQNFFFFGFLPEKSGEVKKSLQKVKDLTCPLIFYSAPHDVDKTVSRLAEVLGDRKAVAVREITKLYEQRVDFSLASGYSGEKRGEFVIIVEGNSDLKTYPTDVKEHVLLYTEQGIDKKEAIKLVAKERGVAKNDIYKLFFED